MKHRKSIQERSQKLETELGAQLKDKTIKDVTVLALPGDLNVGDRRHLRINFYDGTCFVVEWDDDLRLRFAVPGKDVPEEKQRDADLFFLASDTIGKALAEAGM